jgi:hypothetical protein
MSGLVCGLNPSEPDKTLRLGKVVFKTAWPQEPIRHSFGS